MAGEDPYSQVSEEQKKQEEAAKQLAATQAQPAAPTTAPAPTPAPIQAPAQPAAPTPAPQKPVIQNLGQPAQQLQQPASPTRQRTPTPVTSYQRLQDYLRSGQTQAQGLGGRVQQTIATQAAAGSQALGQASQNFSQQVEAAGLTRDADRTATLISKAANLKQGEKLTPEELAELQKIASTQQGFEGLAPADLTAIADYAAALDNLGQAKVKAGLTASEAGRESLLGSIYSDQAPYTSGQSLLDQLLLGSSQQPATQMAGLRDKLVGQDVYGKAITAAEQAAQDKRAAEAEEISKAVGDVTTGVGMEEGAGALGGIEKTIKDRIAAENKRVSDTNALIDQAQKDGNFANFGWSPAQQQLIKLLGLTDIQVNDLKQTGGIRDDMFIKLKEMNIQTGTSADELAKLNALYQIADMYGRTTPEEKATEGADLGSLLDQKAGLDVDKVEAAKKEAKDRVEGQRSSIATNLSAIPVPDYRFNKGADIVTASRDIIERMTDGHFVEDDNNEADKIIKLYQGQLDNLNNYAKSIGVPGTPGPDLSDINVVATMKKMFNNTSFGRMYGNFRAGFKNIDVMQERNPSLWKAMFEQAKRIVALEYFNKLFDKESPQWRRDDPWWQQ